MRAIGILLFVVGLLAAGAAVAQTPSALTCEDFRPTPEALERFPNLKGACEDIVERDGELFAKFTAVVRRTRGNQVTLYLPATDRTVTLRPDSSARVLLPSYRKIRPRDLRRDQEIRIYLAASEFAKPDVEEVVLVTETDMLIEVEIEETPALPTTASIWPNVAAAGLFLLGIGFLLRRRRLNAGLPVLLLAGTALLAGAPAAEADSHTRKVQIPTRVSTVTVRTGAIIEAIDKEKREIRVIDAAGNRFTIATNDTIETFDQLEPRDRIVVEYLESVAVLVVPPDAPALPDATAIELTHPGGKPAVAAADTFMVRATVEAVNATDRLVIVRGERGNVRTVKVAADVPIDKIDVGDEVRLRITQAVAVSVQPAD